MDPLWRSKECKNGVSFKDDYKFQTKTYQKGYVQMLSLLIFALSIYLDLPKNHRFMVLMQSQMLHCLPIIHSFRPNASIKLFLHFFTKIRQNETFQYGLKTSLTSSSRLISQFLASVVTFGGLCKFLRERYVLEFGNY